MKNQLISCNFNALRNNFVDDYLIHKMFPEDIIFFRYSTVSIYHDVFLEQVCMYSY